MSPTDRLMRSDMELVRRIQLDDVDALGALFDRYCTKAFGLAWSLCRQLEPAEDVVAATFIALWQGRASDPEGSGIGMWTMGQVRHRAVDAYRRDAAGDPGVLDEADGLARLPQAQRDVITLAFYGDLMQAEIADRLEISVEVVREQMRGGLVTLLGRRE